MIRRTVLATCIGVGLALATATPAMAADGTTITVEWLTTNTSEPTAETVQWNQTLLADGDCGWVQSDVYRYGTPEDIAAVDLILADGVLTQGEDYGVIVSWSFRFIDCAPVQPPDVVSGASSTAVDCVSRIRTVTQTETRATHALVEGVWVLQEPVTVEVSSDTGEASVDECPLPVTPPEAITPEPTVIAPATTAIPTLAETGPITGALIPVGAALITLGGILRFARKATQ